MNSAITAVKNIDRAKDALVVTWDNFSEVGRGLPFAVRQAFRFGMKLECGRLVAILPDGRALAFQGRINGPEATFNIHDFSFARRLAHGGDIGLAEAYLRGEWDTPNLTRFLELFCVNHAAVATLLPDKPWIRLFQRLRNALNRNSKSGSRRNIHAHYDLGNAFYSAWLDPSMTYSSAIYADEREDLAVAQQRKYAKLAERIGVKPDEHVLEIGCGWGGFAEYAASKIGCKVTGLTISKEQFDFAQKRVFEAGLNERVTLKLQDYRDERGIYDHIASIEMFEAVGEQYWPVYFDRLSQSLKPGGKAGIQTITIQDRLFENYRREIDFIRRYIFPGGMLPTPTILQRLGTSHGLNMVSDDAFGLDYARTLSAWRDSFRAAWPRLTPLGFDERFRRMWEYYLAYCEAGFRSGNIDVRQMVFIKS
jgi:cyclopropane-fatty-acyl-phospholipid synthase